MAIGQSALENLVIQACQQFWQGKQALLIGYTSFKGAWLALWLQRLGRT